MKCRNADPMKARVLSALLALCIAFTLLPPALAAPGDTPPYSLEYLDGIEGSEYIKYVDGEEDDATQVTLEIYDVLYRSLQCEGNWIQIIAPFRQRFTDAGFAEAELTNDTYQEPTYYYLGEAGDLFIILGEKESQAVMNESAIVYVRHLYYPPEKEAPSRPDAPAAGETPATPSGQMPTGLNNFQKSDPYTPGQFTDVSGGDWYAASVQSAVEYGLMKGTSGTAFDPTGTISTAEALTLACRIHSTYHANQADFTQGEPWYQVYVDYAAANGIPTGGTAYNAPATRQQVALMLAAALPAEALPAINQITKFGDSASLSASALPAVLQLYNAGILTGSDDAGTFHPDSTIQRCEVAALAARIADPTQRKTFTPKEAPAAPVTLTVDNVTSYLTITVTPGTDIDTFFNSESQKYIGYGKMQIDISPKAAGEFKDVTLCLRYLASNGWTNLGGAEKGWHTLEISSSGTASKESLMTAGSPTPLGTPVYTPVVLAVTGTFTPGAQTQTPAQPVTPTQPETPAQPSGTTASGYAEFPEVPDFGAYSGKKCTSKASDVDLGISTKGSRGIVYQYNLMNNASFKPGTSYEGYYALLEANGFTGKTIDKLGDPNKSLYTKIVGNKHITVNTWMLDSYDYRNRATRTFCVTVMEMDLKS